MAATTTGKGTIYRLFKVAAELNIGKETVVEFLHQKGFEIADKPTSGLTQEMYDLVMGKFEKEHRQIEKQRKKVDAYHEKRTKTKEDAAVHQAEERTKAHTPKEEAEPALAAAESVPVEAPVAVAPPETAVVVEVPVQEPTVATPPVVAPAAVVELPEVPEPIHVEVAAADTERDSSVRLSHGPATNATISSDGALITAEDRAQQLDDARQARLDQLRAIAQKGRKPVVKAVVEPVVEEAPAPPEPVVEPTVDSIPGIEVVDGEKSEGNFVSPPPRLQGLTVRGKITVVDPKQEKKELNERRKRKRIREGVKSVDITTGGQNRPAGGTTTGTTGPKSPTTGTGTGTGTGAAAAANAAANAKKKLRSRGSKLQVNQDDVNKAIRQTMSRMDDAGSSARQKRSRNKRDLREERNQMARDQEDAEASLLQVTEYVTVAELANLMNVDVAAVIGKCIALGLMVSINQRLEKDTIQLVADEFGYTVEFQQEYAEDLLVDSEDEAETLVARAPIVTIMGHVDHGKTSLLDYVRSANVVAGEAGGITQHIGAYAVQLDDGRKITFLDTPGHEAFTAMRARGAQVTDIVILIVAADDSVMPQTVEAISHAQAAGVPMVIAINKVDKPDANPERIKQQLADRGVLVEEWGGRFQSVEISAKTGLGIEKLLDTILLEAEILDLKANPDRHARGVVIEAEIDRGKGIVATVLVQKGTLRVGDTFVAGQWSGRVRALLDERGNRIISAGPSAPAQVVGFSGAPTAGDSLVALENERDARDIAVRRQQLKREQEFKQGRHITLDDISEQIARGGVQHLPLIIKGDVDGSVEALADSLLRLSTPEVQVSVIMKSVGEISESDVLLATASNAIIMGFHVRPNLKARKLAEKEGVDIRTYQIIYDAVNEIRLALEGMLKPEQKEVITGTVEVRDIFKISKLGVIAGCYVVDGRITRNDRVRLLRDGLEIFTGGISSLRRIKEDVREVESGFECGIALDGMNDVKVGDVIEAFKMVEVKRKLEPVAAAGH